MQAGHPGWWARWLLLYKNKLGLLVEVVVVSYISHLYVSFFSNMKLSFLWGNKKSEIWVAYNYQLIFSLQLQVTWMEGNQVPNSQTGLLDQLKLCRFQFDVNLVLLNYLGKKLGWTYI